MSTRCLAQRADSSYSISKNSPIQFWPLALLSVLPPVLSPDDSLRQRAYRRNRVKTVVLVQLRSGSPADTLDYTELDREGHIVRYRPAFGQTYRQRYNRQHQLVARVNYPADAATPFKQITYDPATKTTTTQLGPSLTQLTPWQVARSTQHGDTLLTESFFHPTMQFTASPVRRLVLRSFRTGSDTVRTDLLAYNVSEQLLRFESYYRLGSRQPPRESGTIDFGTPTVATERQTPSDAHRLLVASQRTHGRHLPTTRYTYNAKGNLIRSLFIPPPRIDKPKTTTTVNDQGTMTVTISTVADTSSTRYVRALDGQLLREEYLLPVSDTHLSDKPISPNPSFTEYTYFPNGLRKTKVGNMLAPCEYRYTYY